MKIASLCGTTLVAASVAVSLVSCGGGSGSAGTGTGTTPIPTVTRYFYVAPALQSQRSYSEKIIDNNSNTINLTYVDTTTAHSANGNSVETEKDPTNYSVTVSGTIYAIQPLSVTLNNSGQALSILNTSTQVSCSYAPYGSGPTYPITVGANWTNNYKETCGTNAAISYVETGTVLDLEPVTVPAGRFNSLKFQSTLVYTDTNGTVHNKIFLIWRDAATGVAVKREMSDLISGTPITNGYPILITDELQSGTL